MQQTGAEGLVVPATVPTTHPHFDALATHIGPHDHFDDWNQPIPDSLMASALAGLGPHMMATSVDDIEKPRVLVVNLFGGPCTGKSTNAALLFGKLKIAGVEAELVPEYAKDLTWEKRHGALQFQPYVTCKQMWRVARLRDEVDVVVTDSPFILGLAYPGFGSTPSFGRFALEVFDLFHNFNVYLTRGEGLAYNPNGRKQTEDQAREKDQEIRDILTRCEVNHEVVPVMNGESTADYLRDRVLSILEYRKKQS
jgi:hypothetical protein